MTDYVLHDAKGNVGQSGSHAQVLQYLATEGQESRGSSLARHEANERTRLLKRDIGIYDAAAREFNRMHDHLKNALARYDTGMTLGELAKYSRNFKGISEAWDKAYERVLAAVETLDQHDADELRAADSRIAAVPRYAA
jgi:hypothetical protein